MDLEDKLPHPSVGMRDGMGGSACAHCDELEAKYGMLGQAIDEDDGQKPYSGKAPGLNRTYGNVGMGDPGDGVQDRTPRSGNRRRKRR